jgi:hypothetical protein
MNTLTKALLLITMTTALLFGFLHLFIPVYNFERLHIFLFNLCGGGTILLVYTEHRKALSGLTGSFYILSLLYAVFAFVQLYLYAIAVSVVLAIIVETIRMRRFTFFPIDFFRLRTPVQVKFHLAALICLSAGLIISSLVMANHEYWKVPVSPKLTLDIFFLGFSFPVSLITMSVMFGMMEKRGGLAARILREYGFWAVNLGVITFFLFILMQMIMAELAVAVSLFIAVIIIFILYIKYGTVTQPKAFLTSGAMFLIMTAVTGILYIILYVFIPQPPGGKLLLKLHALISLYGWNLTGLAVLCRYNDFPIRLHSGRVIALHWVIVTLIAPLGFYDRTFSIGAVAAYAMFLYIILFTRGVNTMPLDRQVSGRNEHITALP